MKALKILFVIHAIVTFAASIALIVAPAWIPEMINIEINREQYMLSYFLGAAELAIAFLSFQSRNITDKYALKNIVVTFIIFHVVTGLLLPLGAFDGINMKIIIGNIILRVIISSLFYFFGINKVKIK